MEVRLLLFSARRKMGEACILGERIGGGDEAMRTALLMLLDARSISSEEETV